IPQFRACTHKLVECPRRRESDRIVALPRIDAMCQRRTFEKNRRNGPGLVCTGIPRMNPELEADDGKFSPAPASPVPADGSRTIRPRIEMWMPCNMIFEADAREARRIRPRPPGRQKSPPRALPHLR